MKADQHLPENVRVSVGSAIVLGLLKGKLDAPPTTIYMLTYREGKCLANCGFCPQARTSTSRADMLARVTWPVFPAAQVIEKISLLAGEGDVKRVCVQALNYRTVFHDILSLTVAIRSRANVPISVSCQPFTKAQMKELAEAGVERISIALDAATRGLFEKIKGIQTRSPYAWERQRQALEEAVEVFSKNQVYTHLIVGLGETEKEIAEAIQWCVDSGVYPSLFAFTPIPGTALENMQQPPIEAYRRVQLARYLMVQGRALYQNMKFDEAGRIIEFGVPKTQLEEAVLQGKPFYTSGCPECNRPYYNERPGGPMYNYPRSLMPKELTEVEKQLQIERLKQ